MGARALLLRAHASGERLTLLRVLSAWGRGRGRCFSGLTFSVSGWGSSGFSASAAAGRRQLGALCPHPVKEVTWRNRSEVGWYFRRLRAYHPARFYRSISSVSVRKVGRAGVSHPLVRDVGLQ